MGLWTGQTIYSYTAQYQPTAATGEQMYGLLQVIIVCGTQKLSNERSLISVASLFLLFYISVCLPYLKLPIEKTGSVGNGKSNSVLILSLVH